MDFEGKETATGNGPAERSESDRRGSGDRRQNTTDWTEEDRRTSEENRRSWVGRRQAAEWRHQ